MTSHLSHRHLNIKKENFGIQKKDDVVGGKSTRATAKKTGVRRALNDITNKSKLLHEMSLKKKHAPEDDFDITEERFLHDHKKCIEARKAEMEACFLDILLPGHDVNHLNLSDSMSHVEYPEAEPISSDIEEPAELPMLELAEQWKSPPLSPVHWGSLPSTPLRLQFEPVEFMLRPEDDEDRMSIVA